MQIIKRKRVDESYIKFLENIATTYSPCMVLPVIAGSIAACGIYLWHELQWLRLWTQDAKQQPLGRGIRKQFVLCLMVKPNTSPVQYKAQGKRVQGTERHFCTWWLCLRSSREIAHPCGVYSCLCTAPAYQHAFTQNIHNSTNIPQRPHFLCTSTSRSGDAQ